MGVTFSQYVHRLMVQQVHLYTSVGMSLFPCKIIYAYGGRNRYIRKNSSSQLPYTIGRTTSDTFREKNPGGIHRSKAAGNIPDMFIQSGCVATILRKGRYAF